MFANKIGKALAGAALTVAATAASAASFNISNDFGSWLSSVGPSPTLGTGTFIGDPQNNTIPLLSGLPGVTFTPTGGGVAYNAPNLTNTLGPSDYLQWDFASSQNGWGGTFGLIGDTTTGLSFQALVPALGYVDVTSVGASQSLSGFLGFSSADQFTSVRVVGTGTFTSYNMENVSIAAVPEPGEWAMMLAGLAVLGFAVKRRRAAV